MTNQHIYFQGVQYAFTLTNGETVTGFVLGANADDIVRLSPTRDASSIDGRFSIAKADIVSAVEVLNPFADMRTIGYRKPAYRTYRLGR